ncbi:MAG: hypothetical protein ACE5R4_16715 [Armatimonadota bacterium]
MSGKTREAVGVVSNIAERKSANGGSYTVLDLAGEPKGFFDWGRHVEAAGVSVGDTVRVEHNGGEFPRMQGLKKLASSCGGKSEGENAETNRAAAASGRDRQIVRMSCLKTAVELLGQSELDYETKELQVVDLAKRMEQWVLR